MRPIAFIIFVLIATPVSVVGGWLAYETWREESFKRNTPLAANLFGPWDEIRMRFRERVRRKFPVGTPVDQVTADLIAEGFEPSAKLVAPGLVKEDEEARKISGLRPYSPLMSVRDPSLGCNLDWIVAWEAAADRHIKAIYGDLRGYCL